MLSAVLVTSCGWMGDTGSVKAATELAVDCQTDAAIDALKTAEAGGGLSQYIAGLEQVGILRDAGRTAEAAEALKAYKAMPEADSSSDAEIEKSIQDFVTELREARKKKTGSASCP
jgi:hypothetical protein